jgi:hypothetical protein
MTNEKAELTVEQEQQLLECYAILHRLAESCTVPSVSAATRMALAELHAAIDGQALGFEYYSHRWSEKNSNAEAAAGVEAVTTG